MMALVPLVLSILIIAAILWQDRPVMDRIPAESVRLEEAENTAELLSGETGGTVSAGSGIEENTAAGNKGKICLLFFLPFLTATVCLMLFGRRPVFSWRVGLVRRMDGK